MRLTTRFRLSDKTKRAGNAENRIFADLLALGYGEKDAFLISHPDCAGYSDQGIKSDVEEIKKRGDFVSYYEDQRQLIGPLLRGNVPPSLQDKKSPLGGSKYKDKDTLIDALTREADNVTGKARADILMKIADLENMKKEDTREERKYLHFYMPLTCENCSLTVDNGNLRRKIEELEGINEKMEEKISRLSDKGEPPVTP